MLCLLLDLLSLRSCQPELKESRPSTIYWAGSGRTNFAINEIY